MRSIIYLANHLSGIPRPVSYIDRAQTSGNQCRSHRPLSWRRKRRRWLDPTRSVCRPRQRRHWVNRTLGLARLRGLYPLPHLHFPTTVSTLPPPHGQFAERTQSVRGRHHASHRTGLRLLYPDHRHPRHFRRFHHRPAVSPRRRFRH